VPQIVYGMSLGWGWTCVLGFAYLQNPENDFPGLSSIFLWLGILLVILPWQTDQIRQAYPQALVQPQPPISYNTWVQEGWRQVPTYREDIQGQEKQPLNIQFYGDTLELAQQLSQSGWEQAAGFSFRRMLAHFSPDSDIHDLLVLPSLHKGYPETLRMSKKMEDCRLILRLWSVAGGENEENPSLWVGMVGKQVRREYLGLFSLAVQDGRHDFGIDQLLDDLGPGYTTEYEKRRSVRIQGWDGRVTLVYKKAQPKETDQPGPS
ncbi:MAG: LssY C-terminal domain-containing protein, partial [Desulfovermiculus sp.]|nr:LssY C-terminal domain-containing protein [Desulfovermiculus sp.]